jgi:hypothetical protein
MIYQVGPDVLTHKPGADGDYDVEEVDGKNERTPRQNVKQSKADTSEGPYETPVILRTKPWAPSVQVDDTEVEDSEIENVITKSKKAKRVSSGARANLG